MGKFGWSYPPGVTGNEPQISGCELPCEVCGHAAGDCICPECPTCGATGDPLCYEQHGLVRNQQQIAGRAKLEARWEEDARAEEEYYSTWGQSLKTNV
jgi:hypothetical protein